MTPDHDHLSSPWGRHPLPGDEPLALELGPLALWLRRRGDEVWMAHQPGDWTRVGRGRSRERPAGPEDADWVRWPLPEGTTALELAPVLPPRPVVAEPELSFRLLPRSRARVFVSVPLWARVDALVEGEPRMLAEIPTATLSDTWWGSPTEGELCYWLSTTARREVGAGVFEASVAVCPLSLSNRSDEELPVEKLSLRVIHLTLFAEERRMWTDTTRVRYRGAEEGSEIEVSGARPEEAPDAVRVGEPREEPPARGFHAWTFARLKSLPGLGGL